MVYSNTSNISSNIVLHTQQLDTQYAYEVGLESLVLQFMLFAFDLVLARL